MSLQISTQPTAQPQTKIQAISDENDIDEILEISNKSYNGSTTRIFFLTNSSQKLIPDHVTIDSKEVITLTITTPNKSIHIHEQKRKLSSPTQRNQNLELPKNTSQRRVSFAGFGSKHRIDGEYFVPIRCYSPTNMDVDTLLQIGEPETIEKKVEVTVNIESCDVDTIISLSATAERMVVSFV